jgi:hypothetical protein
MGEVLMQPMGGGVGSDDVTAAKAQVLTGYNTVTTDSDDEVVEGTMPDNGTNKNAVSVGGGSGSLYAYMPYGHYDNYNNSGNAWINITNDQAKTLANNAGVGYNQGVSDADARVNTSSASYSNGYSAGNSAGYSNGGQTITISGTIAAMHVDRDDVGTRNSEITITIQKDSYVSASCSSVELKSGEVGMYVGGTKRYSAGWSNTGSSSYSGNISAGQSVKFYAHAGGADSQHANMNISLTIRR